MGIKYYKKNKRAGSRMIVQILICIIIVVFVISLKKADLTMTNKLLSIIETSLTTEYNFKEIPSRTVGFLKKIPELPLQAARLIQNKDEQLAFSPPVDEGQVISTFRSSYDSVYETEKF